MRITLRPEQEEACKILLANLVLGDALWLEGLSGKGKTLVALEAARLTGGRLCYVSPIRLLREQTVELAKRMEIDITPFRLSTDIREGDYDVCLVHVHPGHSCPKVRKVIYIS